MKDNLRELIGKRVREIRISKGLSQRQLGSKLGAANSTISAVETGDRNLTIDMLKRISDALDIDIIALLNFEANDLVPDIIKEVEEVYSIPKNYVSIFRHLHEGGLRFKNIEDYHYLFIFIKALDSKNR
jgi:transcriptional regulator with XRE-family HTH domain